MNHSEKKPPRCICEEDKDTSLFFLHDLTVFMEWDNARPRNDENNVYTGSEYVCDDL